MKIIYFLLLVIPMSSYACVINKITNYTHNVYLEFEPGTIIPGYEHKENPNIVLPKQKNSEKPRVVNVKGVFGVGEYLPFRAIERDNLGEICREYRIYVNEKKKEVVLERKDVCGQSLVFEIISEPKKINPDDCLIDINVYHSADGVTIVPHAKEVERATDTTPAPSGHGKLISPGE